MAIKMPTTKFKQVGRLLWLLIIITKAFTCCSFTTTVQTIRKIADNPANDRLARLQARNRRIQNHPNMADIAIAPAQLQAIVQQATVQAALAAVVPAAPAAPAFALGPGGGTAVWDFTSTSGLKLYLSATASLGIKFDGKQIALQYFLDSLRAHGETFGWTELFIMPDAEGVNRDITIKYGALTEASVRVKAITSKNSILTFGQ
jgi:hypothetical protein